MYCNQRMNKVTTSTTTRWGDYELTIKGLPAYECVDCGDKIFTASVVDIIQEIAAGLAECPQESKPDILNVDETAEILGVSKQTIYNMLKDGRLRAVKVGREWRFDSKEIKRLLPASQSGRIIMAARSNILSEKDASVIQEIRLAKRR